MHDTDTDALDLADAAPEMPPCSLCGERPRRRPDRSWCEPCRHAYAKGYRARGRRYRTTSPRVAARRRRS